MYFQVCKKKGICDGNQDLTVRKDAIDGITSLWLYVPSCLSLRCSSFWQGQLAHTPHKAEMAAPLLKDDLPELWFIYGLWYFTRFASS